MTEGRPNRRPLWALAAASILLHLVVLGLLGRREGGVALEENLLARPQAISVRLAPWPEAVGGRPPRVPDRQARVRATPAATSPAPSEAVFAAPVVPTTPSLRGTEPPADPRIGRLDAVPLLGGRGLADRLACQTPERLDPSRRADCERRLAAAAERVGPITGSGDARRDARFARQGAAALTRYEERRASGPMEDIPCDKSGPIAECEVEIKVDIWSSTRGWLPNQRHDD